MGIVKQNKKRISIFDSINYILMIAFCISILFPFWDVIVLSFSSSANVSSLTLRLWPKKWDFDAYAFALSDNSIISAYAVTIYRTVVGTFLHIILTLFAAYPLSKKDLPFRKWITTYVLIPMFFSGGLIPSYIINRNLGLVDNLLVYVLPGALGAYTIVLVRNYLMSMDDALEESAFIDGAGYATILFKITLPLAKPILATIALWSAVGHWNSWMDCLIYIRDERKIVMQMILRRMIDMSNLQNQEMQEFMMMDENRQVTSQTVQAAVTMITIVPIIMAYPFLQKYFVKGIMVGSLKG